jgi:hypothetical protein
MKAKNLLSSKWLIVVLFLFLFSASSNAQSGHKDTTIRITAKDLHAMPASQFLNANSNYIVSSCIVTLEDGIDLVEFKLKSQNLPDGLKSKLSQAKPGKLVIVESRIALVDGKEKKLPALIYSIIE